jgi:peptidoglycan/xylan/chitin deacetylase (PgdA/CDA1 family)
VSFGRSWARLQGFYQRRTASRFFRRPFAIESQWPVISFTFDDFPLSALRMGGAILNRFGVAGTYYASLGLAGQDTPTGRIFAADDLRTVLDQGHELGCHTFSHCDSFQTPTDAFELSVVQNQAALKRLLPDTEFRTFSYPISLPRLLTKSRVAHRFLCCRGGGQTFNVGTADLNLLSAFFLEKSRNDIQIVKRMIDRNHQARGWLILATHDVSESPTQYGCTPRFFEDVVQYAVSSGARILPVVKALENLQASAMSGRLSDLDDESDTTVTKVSA